MIRNATAVWRGGPGAGEGSVSTSSGVIRNALYSLSSGFGNEPCTSPGEMLAAAEASCMSLMFAQELAKAGVRPQAVKTHAELRVEEVNSLWTITAIHLNVEVEAPGIDPEAFHKLAETAKARCPITRALNAKITMDARFTPVAVHAVV
ncbi:MAG TPA: OsmC family peroxiredoxin [Terriglobales bacterium]|nr:OsmC family peroxiredoxin [Terriglobales bacterium]